MLAAGGVLLFSFHKSQSAHQNTPQVRWRFFCAKEKAIYTILNCFEGAFAGDSFEVEGFMLGSPPAKHGVFSASLGGFRGGELPSPFRFQARARDHL